jgi:hypothetical protein
MSKGNFQFHPPHPILKSTGQAETRGRLDLD